MTLFKVLVCNSYYSTLPNSMLKKLFGAKKHNMVAERRINPPLGHHVPPKSASFSMLQRSSNPPPRHQAPAKSASFSVQLERSENRSSSAALKIIHAGGIVEYYYMATPAARILDKNPSFILARPDVFRNPWDSVVKPDEILIPGQKYYVVPKRTLKKLRQRIKKDSNLSFISQDSTSKVQRGIIKNKNSDKTKAQNRRVRFFGIDFKEESCSVSLESKEYKEENYGKSLNQQRRVKNVFTWQPSLTVVDEK